MLYFFHFYLISILYCIFMIFFFFFFKQKTAYEMRISDWSSDVCSSDLNSETTYRLYDYGRPRELHLDDGVAVADPQPYVAYPSPGRVADDREILVDGPKFVLERLVGGERTLALPDGVTAWLIPVPGNGLVAGASFSAGGCLKDGRAA